jgi:fido (protein-threonine AMPylation protein)
MPSRAGVQDTDAWEYSADELRALGRNLLAVAQDIARGSYRDRPYSIALAEEWHRRTFGGVRDHAGRVRRPGFGPEYLTFGERRSLSAREVERALRALEDLVRRRDAEVRDRIARADPDAEERIMECAVEGQVELVRIHPFCDGNGRAARAFTSYFLVRHGLRPVRLERPRGEYISCLEAWLTGDRRPLIALYWECYTLPEQPREEPQP